MLGAGLQVVDPVAGAPDRYAALLRFVSDDLASWTYAGVFHHVPVPDPAADVDIDTGEMWECPAYAVIPGDDGEDVSVLIVCPWYRTPFPSMTIALLADRAGDQLVQRSAHLLEDGDALYAPSLLHAPDGRILLWGWVRELRDAGEAAAAGWSGALTFPRRLSIRDGALAMWPVAELDALRAEAVEVTAEGFALPVGAEVMLAGSAAAVTLVSGDVELVLRLEPKVGQASVGEFTLAAEPDAADGTSWLRVVVDGSVVEAYTSAGRTATTRTYPADHVGWTARIEGDSSAVRAWTLRADAGLPS